MEERVFDTGNPVALLVLQANVFKLKVELRLQVLTSKQSSAHTRVHLLKLVKNKNPLSARRVSQPA